MVFFDRGIADEILDALGESRGAAVVVAVGVLPQIETRIRMRFGHVALEAGHLLGCKIGLQVLVSALERVDEVLALLLVQGFPVDDELLLHGEQGRGLRGVLGQQGLDCVRVRGDGCCHAVGVDVNREEGVGIHVLVCAAEGHDLLQTGKGAGVQHDVEYFHSLWDAGVPKKEFPGAGNLEIVGTYWTGDLILPT